MTNEAGQHGTRLPTLPRPYVYMGAPISQKKDTVLALVQNTITGEILTAKILYRPQLNELEQLKLQVDAQYIMALQHNSMLSYRSIYYSAATGHICMIIERPGQSLLSFCTESFFEPASAPPEPVLWSIAAQVLSLYNYLYTQEQAFQAAHMQTQYINNILPTIANVYIAEKSASIALWVPAVGATCSGIDYAILQEEDLQLSAQRPLELSAERVFNSRIDVLLSLKALGLLLYNVVSFGFTQEIQNGFLQKDDLPTILQTDYFASYSTEFRNFFPLLVAPELSATGTANLTASTTSYKDVSFISLLSNPMIQDALFRSLNVNVVWGVGVLKRICSICKRAITALFTSVLRRSNDEYGLHGRDPRLKLKQSKQNKMRVSFHTDLSVQNYDKNSCINPNMAANIVDRPPFLARDFVLSATNDHFHCSVHSIHESNKLTSTPNTAGLSTDKMRDHVIVTKECDFRQFVSELRWGRIRPYRYRRTFICDEQPVEAVAEPVTSTNPTSSAFTDEFAAESGFFVSPLIVAAQRNDIQSIKGILPRYTGLRSDSDGMTALMFAAEKGFVEAVIALRNYEACLRSTNLATALMIAVAADQTDAAKCLIEKEQGATDAASRTALRIAVERNNAEIAFLLAEAESEIGDLNNYTPLMYSIEHRNHDIAKILAPYASRQQTIDEDKKTALLLALEQDYLDIANLLLSTDMGLQDKNGTTALIVAIERGHTQIASKLVLAEQGMVDIKDRTALMYAAKRGHSDLVESLISAEAGRQDAEGLTALMVAASKGHADIVRILALHEAGKRNKAGQCAIDFALYKKNCSIIAILLEYEGRYLSKETLLSLPSLYIKDQSFNLPQINALLKQCAPSFSFVGYAAAQNMYNLMRELLRFPEIVTQHDHLYLITYLQRRSELDEPLWEGYYKAVQCSQTFRMNYLIMNARIGNGQLSKYVSTHADRALSMKIFLEYTIITQFQRAFEGVEQYCATLSTHQEPQGKRQLRPALATIDAISFFTSGAGASVESSGEFGSPMELLGANQAGMIRPAAYPFKALANFMANILIDMILIYSIGEDKDETIDWLCSVYNTTAHSIAVLTNELRAHNMCFYCRKRPMTVVHWPCRHLYMCADCAKGIAKQRCTICGTPIRGSITIAQSDNDSSSSSSDDPDETPP